MSYNSNIPQGTDPILQSQAQIRANFQVINRAFNGNHFSLTGDEEFQGYHTVLTMRPESGDPTTAANTVALYNKLDSSMIPELFFRPNSDQTPIQLTYSSLINSGEQQYSFVAGPFIVYGGLLKAVTNGQVVTLAPASTLLYVGLTSANVKVAGNTLQTGIPINITASSFTIKFQLQNAGFYADMYYLAIGM